MLRIRRGTRRAVTTVAALALVVTGTGAAAAGVSATATANAQAPATQATVHYSPHPACSAPAPGTAACLAIVDGAVPASLVTGAAARRATAALARPGPHAAAQQPDPYSTPGPYMAADLQAAYDLPSALLGSRQTIAIVDAYDDPDAAADLAAYRAANDLPACDASFPCFEKVNQEGQQGSHPPSNANWAVEESLDLDMASAICPNCKIILVEADSNADSDLAAAEDEAASLGANVISNSYGSAESSAEAADCQHYDHPGIAITASAGDSGFGVNVPSACGTVTAVGGTTLYPSATQRGWTETAWEYTGSGCSAYIAKPAWQHDRLCGMRATADVSAVADIDTPVAVYDTSGETGWVAVGGTSVASPIIAGVYALAGNAAGIGSGASYVYAHSRYLFDVTAGAPFTAQGEQSDGYCEGGYLCTAGPGYDGPTGLGTPDGTGAF